MDAQKLPLHDVPTRLFHPFHIMMHSTVAMEAAPDDAAAAFGVRGSKSSLVLKNAPLFDHFGATTPAALSSQRAFSSIRPKVRHRRWRER